ncbi:MAG: DNA gyrase subunit A [Gammaproteobacteria bacterium]|nr:MAG: DNA gyrase subunit A [Gammaproteobacteria bacterium]RKZ42512.1 MAG: DNA gyrase subunit A [Gammaproteobacteria bacterium]
MVQFAKEILPVNIEDEMKQSYLDYAMSVIVGRALPDVRDGLKPVHRRSLYAMHELGNVWNKPYKKSARIVGETLGRFHPHGDASVYNTIVRMAQPFSLRYMLVDGQGNFGSIDADNPASMRYTEVRMSKIAHELLTDIDKETVDFAPNYDESEIEPTVFPARIPNLLINGASGIAVGMATNIPPHNLREVINACIALIDEPNLTIEDLMKLIPGPDFPTAGIIYGLKGILEGYRTGRGRVYIRARTEIEGEEEGKQKIIVTQLPYQVNKARLIEKIAELIKDKKIEGITALRDESDKDGIRVVIELRRGEIVAVVLNNLFQHTQLQSVFSINTVALVDGQPRLLNLKQLLEFFIRHRREVVTRRTVFELRKARERAHILEGLAVALSNIDAIIVLIKAAKNPQEARVSLSHQSWKPGVVIKLLQSADTAISRPSGLSPEFGLNKAGYSLSDTQVQAILELRLHRLTGLEQDKILEEFQIVLNRIHDLLDILNNTTRLMQVIRLELEAIRDEYGDERRTQIVSEVADLSIEDLITEENVLVTLSHESYIKAQALSNYSAQRRGGKGKAATQMKEEDFIDKLFIASTHDTLLCFTNLGKVYWLKVYQLPQASRISRGKPIVNLLPLEEKERINAILPIREFVENKFVFMATAKGTVKKTALSGFSRPRTNGIIAINLDEDDQLIGVDITDGQRDVMLFTQNGKAVRFMEEKVRAMGRTARGIRGIRLAEADKVISLIINTGGTVLTATVNGFGKRTYIDNYPVKGRGGKGVIAIKTSDRNGKVVSAVQVEDDDDIVLISNCGTLVRTPVNGISIVSRNTQGVNLIRLGKSEQLVGLDRILDLGTEEES